MNINSSSSTKKLKEPKIPKLQCINYWALLRPFIALHLFKLSLHKKVLASRLRWILFLSKIHTGSPLKPPSLISMLLCEVTVQVPEVPEHIHLRLIDLLCDLPQIPPTIPRKTPAPQYISITHDLYPIPCPLP